MIFDSIKRGGNAKLERGVLAEAGIRVTGDVLSGRTGLADAQEREALQRRQHERRMAAEELLRGREREKPV